MRTILTALCLSLILPACSTIDTVFGPPVGPMTKREITDYCIKWPGDNVCQRWIKGDYPPCSDC